MTTNPAHRVQRAAGVLAAGLLLLCPRPGAAQEVPVEFDIPSQAADAALREFARQAGRRILFSYSLVAGRITPALTGALTPSEAVDVLASALGLAVTVVDSRTLVLVRSSRVSPEVPADKPATAATLPLSEGPRVRPAALEEVVVTAQKRAEVLQQVPVSVAVVSGETARREGVRDVRDIQKVSTVLDIGSNFSQSTVIGIRGLRQTGFAPTGDTLAAVHLDGAFISSVWGLNGLMFDLERIEVLAGPQGTLYGRNTAAGTVNLVTRRPDDRFSGDLSLETGSYDTIRVGGSVSLPVHETLSLRVAGQRYTRDPLFSDGSSDQDQWGMRLSAAWRPANGHELLVTADYADFRSATEGTTLYAVDTSLRLPDGSVPRSVTEFAGLPTLGDAYDNLPYVRARGLEPWGPSEQTHWGVMGQYALDFEPFSAVVQYSHRELRGVSRASGKTPSQLHGTILPNAVTSDTAEIRLLSPAGQPVSWVGGLFYAEAENLGWNATPVTGNGPDPVTGLPLSWCPCSSGFFPNAGHMYSYAVFGQATWTPVSQPRLRLTAGLRYTFDWKDATLGYWVTTAQGPAPITAFGIPDMPPEVQALFHGVPDLAQGDNDRTWSGWQYRLGLERDVGQQSMVYGSVATGYKSGGLTYGSTPELRPEDLLALEIGTKNRFLDSTLELNAAAWWYRYTDLEANITRSLGFSFQLPNGTFADSAPSTASVGRVHLAGVSADLEWNFTDRDRLGLSVTHVHSSIRDGTEVLPSGRTNIVFNEGERLGSAPRWQALARYSHTFLLGSGATLQPQLKYQWQSEKYDAGLFREQAYYPAGRNPIQTRIPAQGILDASIRYRSASERWDVTAYVNNVTDELALRSLSYGANPANAASTWGHVTATLGDPRLAGLILGLRF